MNDPTDYIFARDVLYPEMKKCGVKVEPDKIPYIVSFSKKKDNLLMWRLYHSEVALILDSNMLPREPDCPAVDYSETLVHGEVTYTLPRKNDILKARESLLKNPKILFDDSQTCDEYNVITFVKNKAFELENEYRMVKINYEQMSARYNPNASCNCEFHKVEYPGYLNIRGVKNRKIQFYKNFNIKKEALKEIIFYTLDKKEFEKQEEAMKTFLKMTGYELFDVKIRQTNVFKVKK
jgi:hypothetical protein